MAPKTPTKKADQRVDMLMSPYYPGAGLQKTKTFEELGVTGLRQYGGFVVEEWLRQLSGPKAAWVWREMADNDATVGSIIFAVEMLARGVEWTIEEGSDPKAAEFVEECRNDMASTWGDLISEILTFPVFGFSMHEIVYKRRKGQNSDPASRYDDGKIGWRKIPIRAQETIWRWMFDENGGIQACEQISWDGQPRVIPMEKALLFRTRTTKNNPQGRSALRNAYTTYYYKKEVENLEVIGIERDLAGIPTLTPPDEVDLSAPGNKELREGAQNLVRSLKRDEYEGIVLPSAGWKLELISSGGSRQIDTNEVITRYKQEIATSILADMLLTGQNKVGSYAMVDVKADIFGAAVDTWLDGIAGVFNRYAIPRLLKLNGIDTEQPPELKHGTTRRVDLDAVAQLLERLSLAGAVVFPDKDLQAEIYERAGLPTPAAVDLNEETPEKPEPPPVKPGEPTPERQARDEPNGEYEPPAPPPTLIAKSQSIPPLATAYKKGAKLAEAAFKRNTEQLLNELGEEAARAYTEVVGHGSLAKADADPDDKATTSAILSKLDLVGWVRRMARTWHQHFAQVMQMVLKALGAQLSTEGRHPDVPLTPQTKAAVTRQGALRVAELEVQTRVTDSIERALGEARSEGVGWKQTAERIKDNVSAGPFVKAGAEYRANLIAQTETTQAQCAASIAAYEAHPEIVQVELLDGLRADSDEACKERSGRKVSFEEAAQEVASPVTHPACTLTLLPVFVGEAAEAEPELRRRFGCRYRIP